MSIRIGTSGWSYEHWKGRFYPVELAKTAHEMEQRGAQEVYIFFNIDYAALAPQNASELSRICTQYETDRHG